MEEEKVGSIDVRQMALKCTTKAEVYKVLTTSGSVYLPPIDQVNCDFIRDIISGDKLYIECNNVKIIEVPHIEGLRIPDLLEFAEKHCPIEQYMPDYNCEKYPSRNWICNVVNSLIHQKFQQFVNDKITENNDKIDVVKGNKFSATPRMEKIFADTKFLSKRRGRFHQLIKNSKKRRDSKVKEVEKDKRNQEMIDCMQQQADEIEHLKEKLDQYAQDLEDHSRDTELLKRLFERGYIDIEGNPIERNLEEDE